MCVYVHMYVYIYIHMIICIYVYMCVDIYLYMYIVITKHACMYVCMYVCVYIFIFICLCLTLLMCSTFVVVYVFHYTAQSGCRAQAASSTRARHAWHGPSKLFCRLNCWASGRGAALPSTGQPLGANELFTHRKAPQQH